MKNHNFKILKILLFFLCVPIINTSILAMSVQKNHPVPEALSASKPAQDKSTPEAIIKDSCCICLTEFEPENPDEKTNKLNCSHAFHASCINQWFLKSGNITCPLCRARNTDILEALTTAVNTNDIVNLVEILEKYPFLANYIIDPIEQNTILHDAAAKGLKDVVHVLLMYGANARARNLLWEIPLHLAAANGHRATASRLCSRRTVNTRDQYGFSPLHRAASGGWVKTIQMLIARGADKNSQSDFTKRTPLHCAVIQKKYLAVQELLQQNADPSISDWQDKMPIDYALLYGKPQISTLLVRHRFAGLSI